MCADSTFNAQTPSLLESPVQHLHCEREAPTGDGEARLGRDQYPTDMCDGTDSMTCMAASDSKEQKCALDSPQHSWARPSNCEIP